MLPAGDGQIEVVAATHNIPACGYLLQRQGKGWLFTGDTWRNPALWHMLNTRQGSLQLKTIVADAAFHNDAHDFAELCGHLTIADLADDIQVLEQQYVNLFVTHRKPADSEQLPQEMLKLQEMMARKGGQARLFPEPETASFFGASNGIGSIRLCLLACGQNALQGLISLGMVADLQGGLETILSLRGWHPVFRGVRIGLFGFEQIPTVLPLCDGISGPRNAGWHFFVRASRIGGCTPEYGTQSAANGLIAFADAGRYRLFKGQAVQEQIGIPVLKSDL